MSIEVRDRAMASFLTLGRLLHDLGVKEAPDKSVWPSTVVEFLGILFNLVLLTISVPPAKMQDIHRLLKTWTNKHMCTKKELQSLAGKLQFAASCVRPGRVFVARLFQTIAGMEDGRKYVVSEMIKKDYLWWQHFMYTYNGTSIMWMRSLRVVDSVIASDACLKGIGGTFASRYYRTKLPIEWVNDDRYNIAHFELWAIIICVKLWGKMLNGRRFKVSCDNQAVVTVINTGYSKNSLLQAGLRELTFLLAINQCEMVAEFIPGSKNLVPDLLSRWHLSHHYRDQFNILMVGRKWIRDHVDRKMFLTQCDW